MTLMLDLDGTLIDCEPRQTQLLAAILEEVGAGGIDMHAVWTDKRRGLNTRAALQAQSLEGAVLQTVSELWLRRIEEDAWLALDAPFAWTADVLDALSELSPLHLLTARRRCGPVFCLLAEFGLARYFATIHVVSPFRAATEKAAVLGEHLPILYCGDTESDAEAALAARVAFVGVTCGQRAAEVLAQMPHAALVKDTRELPALAAERGVSRPSINFNLK